MDVMFERSKMEYDQPVTQESRASSRLGFDDDDEEDD